MRRMWLLFGFFPVFFLSCVYADLYSEFVTDCLEKKMSMSVVVERYKAVVKETETEIKRLLKVNSSADLLGCFDDCDSGYSELQSYLYRLRDLSLDHIKKFSISQDCITELQRLGEAYTTKEKLFTLIGLDPSLLDS